MVGERSVCIGTRGCFGRKCCALCAVVRGDGGCELTDQRRNRCRGGSACAGLGRQIGGSRGRIGRDGGRQRCDLLRKRCVGVGAGDGLGRQPCRVRANVRKQRRDLRCLRADRVGVGGDLGIRRCDVGRIDQRRQIGRVGSQSPLQGRRGKRLGCIGGLHRQRAGGVGNRRVDIDLCRAQVHGIGKLRDL